MARQRRSASSSTIVGLIAVALIMAIAVGGAGQVWAASSRDGPPATKEVLLPAQNDRQEYSTGIRDTAEVRATDASSDATLRSLSVVADDKAVELYPDFDPDISLYTTTISADQVTVEATATKDTASIISFTAGDKIEVPESDDDKLTSQAQILAGAITDISLTVKAGDGATTRTYYVLAARFSRQEMPEITIEANRSEYVAGLGSLAFTLSRTGDTSSALDVTVNFIQEQTWLASTLYDVTFGAGAATTTIALTNSVFSSDVTESGTLTATVDSVSGYDTSGAMVSVSVISQEGPAITVSFKETEYSVAENAGTFEALLVARAAEGVLYVEDFSVSASAINNTASSTGDYLPYEKTLTFVPTDFSDQDGSLVGEVTAVLTIVDDDIQEEDEQFGLELARAPGLPSEVVILDPAGDPCATQCEDHYPVTILDDDPNVTVSYEQDSYEVAEGASSTIKIVLSGDPLRNVTIPITVTEQGGASSTDFTVVSASVEFQAGATSSTLTFAAVQDSDNDDDESVRLGFGDLPPGVTAGNFATTTVTIIDDDDPPAEITIEASRSEYVAGLGPLVFWLTRTGDTSSALDVTVDLTQDQTWLSTTSHTVTIAAGEPGTTLIFVGPEFSEDVTESGTLTATVNPISGYDTSDATVSVSVISQEGPAITVSFEETEYSVAEDVGEFDPILVARAVPGVPYVVAFRVTVSASAIDASSPDDYSAYSEFLTFLPTDFAVVDGSLVGKIAAVLTIVDDETYEEDEQFGLALEPVPGMSSVFGLLEPSGDACSFFCQNHYLITIVDDDGPAVTVSYEEQSYSVNEGGSATVKVTLSADPERTVTVPIVTMNEGGASSTDYRGVPISVEFNSGDTEKTFSIKAVQDFWNDDGESVRLGFGDLPAGVTEGTHTTTTVTIIDDDEGDPALNVGTPAGYWTVSPGSEVLHPDVVELNANLFKLDTCTGRKSFKVFWAGPGDGRQADRWEAYIARHGDVGDVSHEFRTDQGNTKYTSLYGTVWLDGEGSISVRIRGWFGSDGLGEWSPAVSLICHETQD